MALLLSKVSLCFESHSASPVRLLFSLLDQLRVHELVFAFVTHSYCCVRASCEIKPILANGILRAAFSSR
jgi:hypothetical protein